MTPMYFEFQNYLGQKKKGGQKQTAKRKRRLNLTKRKTSLRRRKISLRKRKTSPGKNQKVKKKVNLKISPKKLNLKSRNQKQDRKRNNFFSHRGYDLLI